MASEELKKSVISGPIPGESWTTPPKSMPYEHPPQFTKLEDAMKFLMNQMLEPQYLKQLLGLMDAGMSIEAVARTILFAGFTSGKWTPDLGMLMYKPLMVSLLAIAHKAKLHHTPIVMQESLDKYSSGKLKEHMMFQEAKSKSSLDTSTTEPAETSAPMAAPSAGFMSKQGVS